VSIRNGPPENDAARTASPSHPGPCVKRGLAKTHNRHPQGNAAPRHLGGYAAGWVDGFAAGAVEDLADAYRKASDPVADRVLAGGDD
jgi:hypothetical protein